MKKLLAIILCFLIVGCNIVLAEYDFSSMSYDELVNLIEQASLALWTHDDWQEVEVPAGTYMIGVDIPAGLWTICAPDGDNVTLRLYEIQIEDGKQKRVLADIMDVYAADSKYNRGDRPTRIDVTFENGYLLEVRGVAIFKTYTPLNLGFKFK